MLVIYAISHIAYALIKTKRGCLRGLDLHYHRKFVKGRAGIFLEDVKNMFMSIWGCVSTCIAYATDTFWTLCQPSRGIQGYANLGVCTSCCQNKITMLLDFPKDTQTDSRKFVKGRGGISLEDVKNMFMSIWGCVSTCIAYATDTFWTLCQPSKGIQGYANLGVCTSCCQNKITMLLEFPRQTQ